MIRNLVGPRRKEDACKKMGGGSHPTEFSILLVKSETGALLEHSLVKSLLLKEGRIISISAGSERLLTIVTQQLGLFLF